MRGVCTALFMRDAMEAADDNGELTGPSIKKAMEQMRGHVPEGMSGVCTPSTWTADDHRGTTEVSVYTSNYNDGNFVMEKIANVDVPRRSEWLGW